MNDHHGNLIHFAYFIIITAIFPALNFILEITGITNLLALMGVSVGIPIWGIIGAGIYFMMKVFQTIDKDEQNYTWIDFFIGLAKFLFFGFFGGVFSVVISSILPIICKLFLSDGIINVFGADNVSIYKYAVAFLVGFFTNSIYIRLLKFQSVIENAKVKAGSITSSSNALEDDGSIDHPKGPVG